MCAPSGGNQAIQMDAARKSWYRPSSREIAMRVYRSFGDETHSCRLERKYALVHKNDIRTSKHLTDAVQRSEVALPGFHARSTSDMPHTPAIRRLDDLLFGQVAGNRHVLTPVRLASCLQRRLD